MSLIGLLTATELKPKQVFNFCRLPVRPQVWWGPTYTGPVAKPSRGNTETAIPIGLSSLGIHVLDRFINSHRKASLPRPTSYETHTVAIQWHLKNNWRAPESLEKVIPIPRYLHPHLQFTFTREQCPYRPTITPNKHALQIFTDASKEGWGAL